MPTNDFKALAIDPAANVLTQAQYLALVSILANGMSSGVVPSAQLNKMLRQSSVMAATLGQMIVDAGLDALDNGNIATLEANLKTAIQTVAAMNAPLPTGYYNRGGWQLSRSSATVLAMTAGKARSSSDTVNISAAAMSKSISSVWSVGNGGGAMDTGVAPASSILYWYAINRTADGVGDFIATANPLGPAMPAGYSGSRYIGSWPTSAASQLEVGVQVLGTFTYDAPPRDVNVTNQGTVAVAYTLRVPKRTGILAMLHATAWAGTGGSLLIQPGFGSNTSVAAAGSDLTWEVANAGQSAPVLVPTNSDGQIRATSNQASTTFACNTAGWMDTAIGAF